MAIHTLVSPQGHSGFDRFEIESHGYAVLNFPAERAILKITVSRKGTDRATIWSQVYNGARTIEMLLRELSPRDDTAEARTNAPIDYWIRTSLSIGANEKWNKKTEKHEEDHTGDVSFTAHFRDFQPLARFIKRLSAFDSVKTEPLKRSLTEATEQAHEAELRIQAAKNAQQEALDCAQALGYSKVMPHWLQDAEVRQEVGTAKGPDPLKRIQEPSESRKRNATKMEEDEDEEELEGVDMFDHQPHDIEMACNLDAIFYATGPVVVLP